ncbi:hypothetical protein Emed_006414 [Eimeria media]
MFSSSASPFGTSTAGQGLFGVAQQQPAATGNLFGTQQQQPASTGGGLFGSTTQTNPAGSTLGTGGLFGQQQQTGGGLFGGTAGGGGGGLFGSAQQPQQQNAGGGFFGSSSTTNTTPAGAPAGGGLFGSTTAFGQPQQQQTTGLFGSSTGFGQQQQQPLSGTGGGGLFGGASTTGFGQPQQQQTTGLLGSSAPASTTGGGLFGSSTGVFGQPQQQQQQGGLFGSSTGTGGTTTGLFGQPQQQQQQEPFKPYAVEDGSVMTICHGPYEKVCLEEIRWNFYQQHGRGVGAQGPVGGALTSTSLPATGGGGGGLFGASATGTQGTTGSGFGGGGLFGSNNALQQQPAATGGGGLFGTSNTLQQQQPAGTTTGGGGLFGSTSATTGTSSVFGGSGGGLFGGAAAQPQQQQGGLFGSSSTTTPATGGGLFGSSTGGLFGKPSTGTGFGTTTNTLGSTNQGGGGLFGTSSLGTAGGGGLFGSTTNTANATGTGGLFGQQQQPQQQQQTGGGGLFGGFGSGTQGATTTQANTGGGLFGGSSTQQQQGGGLLGGTTSLFGAKPATGGATTTGLFGSSTNALGSGGGGLFGSTAAGGTPSAGAGGLLGASSTGGGGLFGSSAATGNTSTNTAGGGGLFGNLGRSTGTGSVLGGGLFGSAGAAKTGGGLFGTGGTSLLQQPQQQQQQQQQQGGLFGLGGSGADQQQRQQLVAASGGASSGSNLLALGGLLGAPQVTVHIVLSAANTPPSQLACAPVSSVEDGCSLGGPAPPQLTRKARRFLPVLPGMGGGGLPLSLTQSGSGLGASFSLPPQFLQRQRQLVQQLPSVSPDSSSRNGWLAQTLSKSLAAVQQQQRQALLPLSSLDYQLLQRMQGATGGGAPPGAAPQKEEEAPHAEQPSDGADEQQQQQQQQNTLSIAAAAAAAAVADAGLSSNRSSSGSSSSSSSSSAAEAQQEAARAPLELRPVLTNPEYECVPSISSLQQMSEEELQRVRDFTIRRPGVGKILFPGHTDLRGINLDLVVHIDHLEVSVYADEAPPVGVGLNKKAQVTLCNCKPSKGVEEEAGGGSSSGDSGETGAAEDEAAAAERKQQFVDRVRKYTEKMGARFLSLDVHTWEWRFEVQHFSVYRWVDEEATAADSQQSDAAQAAQVAAFAAAAPAAAAPKEFELHAQRAQILRTAPQAILAAVAQKQQQQQQQRAEDTEAVGQSSEQQQAAVEQRQQQPQQQPQQQQQQAAAAADPKRVTYTEQPVRTGKASEDRGVSAGAASAAPVAPAPLVAAAPAAATAPRSWLKHPPFPVRCAPTLGPRGLCALPVFRAPASDAAAAGGGDSRSSQGAYEVALLQLSPLLPPAAAPHGFVWPQPFAREAAATISAAHAAAGAAAGSSSGCSGSHVAASRAAGWTAGEVPMAHAVQQETPADPLRAEEAVEAAARNYVSSSINSSTSSSGSLERGKAATLEEEGVRVVWDLKESIRLHLFDSGLSVHRGLAAAAAAGAVGEVFEALKDSEEDAATQAEELRFRLKLMQQQRQPQQQLEPFLNPSITQRLLHRMLRFLQQQSSCYAGSLEGGEEPWPPASSWVPSAAAAAATPAAAAAAAASGLSRRYSEASYLSPYMAQTWRLLVFLLSQPTEFDQEQLQRLLQQGPNTELNVSLDAALERRRQLSILDWLLVEGRVMLLSFLRRACAAAALQQQQQQQWLQQQQQQLFLACNARALFEALRAKGELRRFVALLHLLANGQVRVHEQQQQQRRQQQQQWQQQQQQWHQKLEAAAAGSSGGSEVAAALESLLASLSLLLLLLLLPLSRDALQASALPQPPQEVRRVYRLLAGAGPLAEEFDGSSKSRCLSTAAESASKETAAAARAAPAAPATASREAASEDAAAAAARAAAWAEDLPFLDWRAELAAALLFSRETAALVSPPHLREELRPPPQAPDAPRDLKRALLFLEGFGRGRRCSCSACWGSAPLPLYVRQQQEARRLEQLFAASDPQQQQQQQQRQQEQPQQQQQQHFKKLLSEEQFDLQFSLLRQHAGLVPPSLASVAGWRCSPYPLDSQLSWLAGMVLCMHFSNEAARQHHQQQEQQYQQQQQQQQLPPLLWLPDTHWVARLPGTSQASIRKLLQQQQHFSVCYAEQLEISGMWPIACGVLLLSPDRDAGVRAARCLVERYGRELSAEVSVHRRLWATEVLQQHLGIPRSWLQRAHAHLLQSRGRHLQAAFVYIDAYRHTEAPFEGFLGSAAGQKARAALQRQFPLQQEQQELLLAAAAALLKALPAFLQGLLFVLQHRQQQILLHGFCIAPGCGTAQRQQLATTLQQQQQQEFNSALEVEGGSAPLSPEEQMELLLEAITLCCSQQLWPQQQEKLRCCSACIQWMQQEFKLPSAVEGPAEGNDADTEQQQQQQVLQQQLASLLQQRSSCTEAERRCWASVQSALTEARGQHCM